MYHADKSTTACWQKSPGRTTASTLTSTDRKSTRLNSSHQIISYAVFCLKKKKHQPNSIRHIVSSANAYSITEIRQLTRQQKDEYIKTLLPPVPERHGVSVSTLRAQIVAR